MLNSETVHVSYHEEDRNLLLIAAPASKLVQAFYSRFVPYSIGSVMPNALLACPYLFAIDAYCQMLTLVCTPQWLPFPSDQTI